MIMRKDVWSSVPLNQNYLEEHVEN
jgi:hypothetical protein